MNKKIFAATTIATLSLVGVSSVFANTATESSSEKTTVSQTSETKKSANKGQGHRGGMKSSLTEAEKTALSSMTDAEKQAFFEKKHTEQNAKRAAHDAIIDKLLAGTALTAEEETMRQEIIKERTERKNAMAERKNKRQKANTTTSSNNAQ